LEKQKRARKEKLLANPKALKTAFLGLKPSFNVCNLTLRPKGQGNSTFRLIFAVQKSNTNKHNQCTELIPVAN
jgi:hypothetical protein